MSSIVSEVCDHCVMQASVRMSEGDCTSNGAPQQCNRHVCSQASNLVHCLYIAEDTFLKYNFLIGFLRFLLIRLKQSHLHCNFPSLIQALKLEECTGEESVKHLLVDHRCIGLCTPVCAPGISALGHWLLAWRLPQWLPRSLPGHLQ